MAVKLHVYTSTHNDLYMLKYYVRHWTQYAEKIFVYDDDSTDGSREFLESCAPVVEIKSPGFHGIDELQLQEMRNREYKLNSRGRADWVVIGDCDEFHYHPRLLDALALKGLEGFCAVVSQGWQMLSEKPPNNGGQITDAIKDGIPDYCYNRVIFNPDYDVEIAIGHHGFRIKNGPTLRFTRLSPKLTDDGDPLFRVETDDPDFKMLHYRYLGEEYIRARNAHCWARHTKETKAHRWGHHCDPYWTGKYSIDWYRQVLTERVRCIE